MGASVSLLGRFSQDMDPNFSIVVSSRGLQYLDDVAWNFAAFYGQIC